MGTITKTKIAVPVKGSPVKDASGKVVGTAQYNPNTGKPLKDPVITSDKVRASNNALKLDISGLKSAYEADNAQIMAQQAALAERRANEIAGIKTEFDIAKGAKETGQASDYASRATSLITSGGGFLGGTQSQQGVLQNLRTTHETEKTALMAKREAAILAANTAYEDKDFALARELSKNAKDLQNEIYRRQKDFADQTLAITRENRAQTEFDLGIADKKIQSYATMDDATFAAQDPTQIAELDKLYYPGYTNNARLIAKKALDTKTNKEAVALDADILDMRLKIPAGQKFTLNGQTYTGLKQADGSGGGTETERKDAKFNQISELLSGKLNTGGTQLYTIPGTKGIPYIDSRGKLTPEGWLYSVKNFGVTPDEFIKRYAHLFDEGGLNNYQMSSTQKELIRKSL